jgi:hypothetical protein
VLLEEGPKGFDTGTIDIGKTSDGKPGAMRQVFASKQGHAGCLERLSSLKEGSSGAFSADGRAEKPREKINGFIRPEASAHPAHEARAKAESRPFFCR